MKRIWPYIIILFILGLFFFLRLPEDHTWGTDALYHYTVIQESVQQGSLLNENPLEGCTTHEKTIQPAGFYLLPFLLSGVLGIKTAFYASTLLFGILTLLFTFLLFRKLFGQQVALITVLILTALPAFVKTTFAGAYGPVLILPFLLASLYFAYLALEQKNAAKKTFPAILSGFLAGITPLFWNGFSIIIGILFLSILLYIIFQKKRNYTTIAFFAGSLVLTCLISWFINNQNAYTLKIFPFPFTLSTLGTFWSAYWVFLCLAFLGIISYITTFPDKRSRYSLGFLLPAIILSILTPALFFLSAIVIAVHLALFLGDVFSKRINTVFLWFFYLILLYLSLYFSLISWYFIPPLALLVIGTAYLAIKKHKYAPTALFLLFLFLLALFTTLLAKDMQQQTSSPGKLASYDFLSTLPEDACIVTGPNNIQSLTAYTNRTAYYSTAPPLHSENYATVNTFLLTNTSTEDLPPHLIFFVTSDYLNFLNQTTDTVFTLQQTGFVIDDNYTGSEYADATGTIYQERTTDTDKSAHILQGNTSIPLHYLITNQTYEESTGTPGCLLAENALAFIQEDYCSSNAVKMIAGQDIPGLQKIYAQDGITMYQVKQ